MQITELNNLIQSVGTGNLILLLMMLILMAIVVTFVIVAYRGLVPFFRLLAESSKERQEIQGQNLQVQKELMTQSATQTRINADSVQIQRDTVMAISQQKEAITQAAESINKQQDDGRHQAAAALNDEIIKSRDQASQDAKGLREDLHAVSDKVDQLLQLVVASSVTDFVREQLVTVHSDLQRIESKIPAKESEPL